MFASTIEQMLCIIYGAFSCRITHIKLRQASFKETLLTNAWAAFPASFFLLFLVDNQCFSSRPMASIGTILTEFWPSLKVTPISAKVDAFTWPCLVMLAMTAWFSKLPSQRFLKAKTTHWIMTTFRAKRNKSFFIRLAFMNEMSVFESKV